MRLFAIALVASLAGIALFGCQSTQVDPEQTSAAGDVSASEQDSPLQDGVVVYYMHREFRCPTCLKIEQMSRELVENTFAEEMSAGTIQWQTLNYQLHEDMAERYGLNTSSLVLVSYRDEREVSHQVLEGTWSLYGQPALFQEYVAGAIRKELTALRLDRLRGRGE